MKLIITRHGETLENSQKIIQGHLDGTLSELGKEQAAKVAYVLRSEELEYIFSSDLARAFDTARTIARFHPSVPLEKTEALRERYLGDFQGKTGSKKWSSLKWAPEFSRKYNLESPEELFERAKTFYESLRERGYEKGVLLVAHNGINKALITYLLGKSWRDIEKLKKLGNTSITIFDVDKDMNPTLRVLDSIKHLEDI